MRAQVARQPGKLEAARPRHLPIKAQTRPPSPYKAQGGREPITPNLMDRPAISIFAYEGEPGPRSRPCEGLASFVRRRLPRASKAQNPRHCLPGRESRPGHDIVPHPQQIRPARRPEPDGGKASRSRKP